MTKKRGAVPNRRKIGRKGRVSASLALLAAAVGFCIWQNKSLVVSRYSCVSSRVPASFDGYTIVQISDLHNELFGRGQQRLLNAVREAEPDIIVITGDMVDSLKTDIGTALTFARRASEIAPVYYVTGNHEGRLNQSLYTRLLKGLGEAGVRILMNRLVTLESSGRETIELVGLFDGEPADAALRHNMENTERAEFQVLLAHRPERAELYARSGVDLILSGHAHGGQVRLPLIGGLYAPGQGIIPHYTSGPYELGEACLIVSRGLGNSGYTFRVFNRPEIVAVTLRRG